MPWTAHVRAALLALYLVVVTLAAVPTPAGFSRTRLDDPAVKESLDAWKGVLSAIGVVETDEEMADLAWSAGQALVSGRQTLIGPFETYFWLTGTRQSWRMYGGVDRRSARLEIDVHEHGAWRTVYADLTEHDWRGGMLRQERVRTVRDHFSDKRNRSKWRGFVTWMARLAAADFPDADRLRMRFVGLDAADPAAVRERGGQPETGAFWAEERELR